MSFKKYFLYDKQNSNFVPIEYNPVERVVYSACIWIIGGVILSGLGTALLSKVAGTPAASALKAENEMLMEQLEQTRNTIQQFDMQLEELAHNDNELYRSVLGMETISYGEREAGVGGADIYSEFDAYGQETADILKWTSRSLEQMQYTIDIQKTSFRAIKQHFNENREKMGYIPAIIPAEGSLVSGFGMRYHPILKYRTMHEGLDFSAEIGEPVYSTGKGIVKYAKQMGTYGNLVIVDHGYGYETYYAHLSAFSKDIGPGVEVKRGQKIGYIGSTGRSTGPHLHYEVHKDDNPVNPIKYLIADTSPSEYLKMKRQAESSTKSLD